VPAVPRTTRGLETRDRLVEAGLVEFANRGYVAARVESITARAGVGYGTFYRYFSNKADLIAYVADEVYSDIFTQATSETSSERPVRERVFNGYLATLRAYTFHRDALRVLDAAVGADLAIAGEVARLQERDVGRYASIISATPGYHAVGDAYRVSLLVNSMGDELARRWIHSDGCSGDPTKDEPELQRLARVFALMCTAALDPASLGIGEQAISEMMEGMTPDDHDR
jgi:AcrR family transcriptional regulator